MSTTSRTKPRIGVTMWRRDLPTYLGERTDLFTLGSEYADRIQAAGGVPILLPHLPPEDAGVALAGMDGLLVTGGGDVHPHSYGEEPAGSAGDVSEGADASELALIEEARRRQMPTLGICRGAQLLAVAHGGRLMQDLYQTYPHHPSVSGRPDEILGHRHGLTLAGDSVLAVVYGVTERWVNSIHHQCIVDAGDGLRAIGWSDDGMIEAVESISSWRACGVQWHPEKMQDPDERRLFAHFVAWAADA